MVISVKGSIIRKLLENSRQGMIRASMSSNTPGREGRGARNI